MRVASISFWHLHGADYAEDAIRHPDVDLVAAWDEDPERGRSAAARFDVPFVEDLDAVLRDETIEAVIVCSATADHERLVVRCLDAGKHVFMEKVLSDSLAGARSIVDAAERSGTALTVSLWRSDKGYTEQIADLVASGVIGQVTSARVRDGHPFALPMESAPRGYLADQFYDPAQARGGALIDLCHPLYLLTRIVGSPARVVSAFGSVTSRDVEDNAAVLMSYPDGAIAVAETSYVTRITPFLIEVHGTEGSILYSEPGIGALVAQREAGTAARPAGEDDEPRLRFRSTRTPDTGWTSVAVAPDQPVAFARWVEHVRTGTRDGANLRLALALSGLVEAAYASAAHGSVTPVPRLVN